MFSFRGGVRQPVLADFERERGMVFRDVAEVIRDTTANVEFGIVFQRVENREHRSGILHEGKNALGPGQARTRSFGAQSAHVRMGIAGPGV